MSEPAVAEPKPGTLVRVLPYRKGVGGFRKFRKQHGGFIRVPIGAVLVVTQGAYGPVAVLRGGAIVDLRARGAARVRTLTALEALTSLEVLALEAP